MTPKMMNVALVGMFTLLLALAAVIVFAANVEFRCAALIFAVIGYPCLLGILITLDPRLR